MPQPSPTPYEEFTAHFQASLDASREARLDLLTRDGRLRDDGETTASMKLREAERFLHSLLPYISPHQREEYDDKGDRFCFTYQPTSVRYSVRDGGTHFDTLGPLHMVASKPSGESDVMRVEEIVDHRRYANFSHSQVLQPSRVQQQAQNTWRYGGLPPMFGGHGGGLSSALAMRAETGMKIRSARGDEPEKYNVDHFFRASQSEAGFAREGLNPNVLASDGFYYNFGFDMAQSTALATRYKEAVLQTQEAIRDYAYRVRRERLGALGLDPASLPDYLSERMLNYLVNSPDATVARYRWNAFEIMRDRVFPGEAGEDMARATNQSLMAAVEQALCPGNAAQMPFQIRKAIDEGQFPAKLLAKAYGYESLSKRQFNMACAMYGRYHYVGHKDTDTLVPNSLGKAMGMAKIPKDWLKYDLFVDNVHPGHSMESFDFDDVTSMVMRETMPFLAATGKEMDRLTAAGDKAGIKALSNQWRWLSSGGESLEKRAQAFDAQYDIVATHKDYRTIIEQLMLSVVMRMISESDDIDLESVLSIDEYNDNAIELDVDSVQRVLFEAIDEENQAMDNSYETEDGEVIYEDPEPASEYLAPLREAGLPALPLLTPDIQTIAQKNQLLHKEYNDLLSHANRNSKLNVSWGTPLGEANTTRVGVYDITCINTRADLLAEGREMAHCVFSYLGALAQGESVVFSVREPESQSRLATVMFDIGETEEGAYELTFNQCYGPRNSVDATVEDIEFYMREWMEDINQKKTGFDFSAIFEGRNEEISRDIMDDAEKHAALLQAVPFSEDGAYMAYFALSRYLPGEMSVMDVLNKVSPTWELIFSRSNMKDDVEQIQALSSQYQASPTGVVTAKQTLPNVEGFASPELAAHLAALMPLVSAIQAEVKPGQSSVVREEVVKKALSEQFDTPLVITPEIGKLLGRPEPDVMAVAALIADGKRPEIKMMNTVEPDAAPRMRA